MSVCFPAMISPHRLRVCHPSFCIQGVLATWVKHAGVFPPMWHNMQGMPTGEVRSQGSTGSKATKVMTLRIYVKIGGEACGWLYYAVHHG
jgi:hypothetical protein